MNPDAILKQFKEKVCEKISLVQKGISRFIVKTPFVFEDGDHLVILLKYNNETKTWYLTDEGHTFLHLGYFIEEKDMFSGTRSQIIEDAKKMFEVLQEESGLSKNVLDNNFGDTLYDFVQCLLKIMDITYLDRKRVQTTFFEDFRKSIDNIAKNKRLNASFNVYEKFDLNKAYPIDCIIETSKKPVYIFAMHNDNKCKDVTITIYEFERKGIKFFPVGVFENQEEINRKVLARFSAICDKQIPSLSEINYFDKYLENYDLN